MGRSSHKKQTVRSDLLKQVRDELAAALAAHKSGNIAAAEQGYKKVLAHAPGQADALNHLGVIRAENEQNEAAIELMSLAARQRPKDANILGNLGKAYLRARRFDNAIEALEQAVSLKPEFPEALGNLIQALRLSGQTDSALAFIDILERSSGDSLMAKTEKARLLSDIGEADAAGEMLSAIVQNHPDYAPAWLALAKSRKWTGQDHFVSMLMECADEAAEGTPSARALYYAAGKTYDDLGEHDRAFSYFMKAKSTENIDYDHKQTVHQFDAIKRTLTSRFFQKRSGSGVASARPIFIVGMPRSGTSLTEQILASHPDVFGAGELEYVAQARRALKTIDEKDRHYPEVLLSISDTAVKVTAMRYLRKINAHNSTAKYVTDKMPHNFIALGLITLMFPKAKIIHCLRDPLDTCLSCYMQDFTQSHAYNRSLKNLGLYYTAYRDLMEHFREVLPSGIYDLQYERAIREQAAQTRSLLSHIGLTWHDNVLDFHRTSRRVGTPSNWQVRQPIYNTSSRRWKKYEKHLGPLIEAIDPRHFESFEDDGRSCSQSAPIPKR